MFILNHLRLPSQDTGLLSVPCSVLNDTVSTAEISYIEILCCSA
jgi:hypothetical protein